MEGGSHEAFVFILCKEVRITKNEKKRPVAGSHPITSFLP